MTATHTAQERPAPQAADKTLEQIVRFTLSDIYGKNPLATPVTKQLYRELIGFTQPSVNIIGITTLGFHNRHDCRELTRLLNELGIHVNVILPENVSLPELKDLPKAWINIVPYREVGLMTAKYLQEQYGTPYIATAESEFSSMPCSTVEHPSRTLQCPS